MHKYLFCCNNNSNSFRVGSTRYVNFKQEDLSESIILIKSVLNSDSLEKTSSTSYCS